MGISLLGVRRGTGGIRWAGEQEGKTVLSERAETQRPRGEGGEGDGLGWGTGGHPPEQLSSRKGRGAAWGPGQAPPPGLVSGVTKLGSGDSHAPKLSCTEWSRRAPRSEGPEA